MEGTVNVQLRADQRHWLRKVWEGTAIGFVREHLWNPVTQLTADDRFLGYGKGVEMVQLGMLMGCDEAQRFDYLGKGTWLRKEIDAVAGLKPDLDPRDLAVMRALPRWRVPGKIGAYIEDNGVDFLVRLVQRSIDAKEGKISW